MRSAVDVVRSVRTQKEGGESTEGLRIRRKLERLTRRRSVFIFRAPRN